MLHPQALALAYALSTVAGLRASLTILALSIAVHVHVIAPPAGLLWLGSNVTLVLAAVFAIADALADKVPVVDSMLHAVHLVLSPVAGGVAAFAIVPAVVAAPSPIADPTITAFVLAGGVIAFAINALRGAIRAASSALSLGILNPIVSIAEDVCAVAALVVAFVAPLFAAAAVLVLTIVAVAIAVITLRAARRRRDRAAV